MTLKEFQKLIAEYPELEMKHEGGWYNVYHNSKIFDKSIFWYSSLYRSANLTTTFSIVYSSYNRRIEVTQYKSIDVTSVNKAKKIIDNTLNDLNKIILIKKEFVNNAIRENDSLNGRI